MIKGVNKHIVEINNPQNDYFEKAILYVRSEKLTIPPKELSDEARNYLDSLGFKKKRLNWYKILLGITALAGFGVAVTGIIMNI